MDSTPYALVPGRKKSKLEEGLEGLAPWEQKAFWLLWSKPETDVTMPVIAQVVGKARETVSRFWHSSRFRKVAANMTSLSYERLQPLALMRLRQILLKSDNTKVVAELATDIVNEARKHSDLDRKLKEFESTSAGPVQINQYNFGSVKAVDTVLAPLGERKKELVERLRRMIEVGS